VRLWSAVSELLGDSDDWNDGFDWFDGLDGFDGHDCNDWFDGHDGDDGNYCDDWFDGDYGNDGKHACDDWLCSIHCSSIFYGISIVASDWGFCSSVVNRECGHDHRNRVRHSLRGSADCSRDRVPPFQEPLGLVHELLRGVCVRSYEFRLEFERGRFVLFK
jgi:hypothetical protein